MALIGWYLVEAQNLQNPESGEPASLFVGVIMKLSNFGGILEEDCQILGAPCQPACQSLEGKSDLSSGDLWSLGT